MHGESYQSAVSAHNALYGKPGHLAGSGGPGVASPAAPSTLVAAIAMSSGLIERLIDLNRAVENLAIRIGGPWPADPSGVAPMPDNPPAMVHLCGNLDAAHKLVTQLEGSVKAIGRSLEG